MAGTMVEFRSNGGACAGYLATPASGTGPGLIVLQEWWGLVDHIKDVCDRFAAEGYVALAPDLFHGDSATSPDDAGKLFMALNIEKTEKDMAGAIEHLLSLPETSGGKVGSVGYCMGGQLSLYAACENPKIAACVDYYGVHPNVHPDFSKLSAPVLGFFAEHDDFVNAEVVANLKKTLEDAGKQVEFHAYPGTNHGFFNDTRSENYHADAAKDTWKRMLEFYGAQLRG